MSLVRSSLQRSEPDEYLKNGLAFNNQSYSGDLDNDGERIGGERNAYHETESNRRPNDTSPAAYDH